MSDDPNIDDSKVTDLMSLIESSDIPHGIIELDEMPLDIHFNKANGNLYGSFAMENPENKYYNKIIVRNLFEKNKKNNIIMHNYSIHYTHSKSSHKLDSDGKGVLYSAVTRQPSSDYEKRIINLDNMGTDITDNMMAYSRYDFKQKSLKDFYLSDDLRNLRYVVPGLAVSDNGDITLLHRRNPKFVTSRISNFFKKCKSYKNSYEIMLSTYSKHGSLKNEFLLFDRNNRFSGNPEFVESTESFEMSDNQKSLLVKKKKGFRLFPGINYHAAGDKNDPPIGWFMSEPSHIHSDSCFIGDEYLVMVNKENNSIESFQVMGYNFKKAGEKGSYGSGKGEFDTPTKITYDGKKNLYVLEEGNKRVQRVPLEGLL